jgi:hypothetical protein
MSKYTTAQITVPCTDGSKKDPRNITETSTFFIFSHLDFKLWYVETDMVHKLIKLAGAVITVPPFTLQI